MTLEALEKFVDGFLAQVDQARPEPKYLDAPVEAEAEPAEEAAPAEGSVEAEAARAAVNHDKELRKAISAMEMTFNSGVANLKKVLDELKDTPNQLAGRAPSLTSTLSCLDRDEAQEGRARPQAQAHGHRAEEGRAVGGDETRYTLPCLETRPRDVL